MAFTSLNLPSKQAICQPFVRPASRTGWKLGFQRIARAAWCRKAPGPFPDRVIEPPGTIYTFDMLRSGVHLRIRTCDTAEMIAQLTGLVDALEDGRCVIDVAGVGYLVHASSRTLAALPRPPEAVKLLVETHVREDAIQLFGFAETAERDWFRLLTTVQGVGPRVALSILSALAPRDLISAIAG